MNIHPIIVHFPIAFLSVYGVLELVRLRYITSAMYWFYIKASIVMIGAAMAGAAYLSGEIAEELVGESRLIEIHSQWAKMTVVIFGFIAVCYAIAWFSRLEIAGRI